MTSDRQKKETDPKIALLLSLTEEQLRIQVVIPLLIKMGLENVKDYHGGVPEKGKDIVGYYTDLLGARHHVAIVIKRGDIHGAIGKAGNASEVLFQAEQALSEPFSDVYDLESVDISECWIITNGIIKNTAIESIRGKLAKSNLDKVTRFIDQERLIPLINQQWPDYWNYDRMISAMAHDMHSPIASAKSQALFIAEHPGRLPIKQAKESALEIAKEMDLLRHLVELSTLVSHRELEHRVEKVDVTGEAMRAIEVLRARSKEKRVDVNLDQLPLLELDREAFRHCIFNLVRNAMQYSPNVSRGIEVLGGMVKDKALIKVRDFGIGIPEGWEDIIFEQGVRAPNAAKSSGPGAGLGLWVTRRLVNLHGGKVLLTSRAQPTEFTIYLPIRNRV